MSQSPADDDEGPAHSTSADSAHDELERERYRELLEELRTIMPGVQVLFAFLLVAPFSGRFPELDRLGTIAFTSTLVTAALAAVVFLAPAPYHRLRRSRNRHERVHDSVRLQLAGLGLLGFAIVQAIFVITRFILDTAAGSLIAALIAVVVVTLWYVLPHLRSRGASR